MHELLVSGNEARCDADSLRQAVKANGSEVERLTLALAGEGQSVAWRGVAGWGLANWYGRL